MKLECLQALTSPALEPGAPAKCSGECNGPGSPFAAMVKHLSREDPLAGRHGAEEGNEGLGRSPGARHPQTRMHDRTRVELQTRAQQVPSRRSASEGLTRAPAGHPPGTALLASKAATPESPSREGVSTARAVTFGGSLNSPAEVTAQQDDERPSVDAPPAASNPVEPMGEMPRGSLAVGEGPGCSPAGPLPQVPCDMTLAGSAPEAAEITLPPTPLLSADVSTVGPTVGASVRQSSVPPFMTGTEASAGARDSSAAAANDVAVASGGSAPGNGPAGLAAPFRGRMTGSESPIALCDAILARGQADGANHPPSATTSVGEPSGSAVAVGMPGREPGMAGSRLREGSEQDHLSPIESAQLPSETNAEVTLPEDARSRNTGTASPLESAEAAVKPFPVPGKAMGGAAHGHADFGRHDSQLASEQGWQSGAAQITGVAPAQDGDDKVALAEAADFSKVSEQESQGKPGNRHNGRVGDDATPMVPGFQGALRSSVAPGPQPADAAPAVARPDETVMQLADHVRIQLLSGGREIRIQLKPDFLGQVEIRAEKGPDGVIARIVTESVSVRDYLEGRLPSLETALREQGIRVDRVEVSVQNGPPSQAGLFDAGAGQGNHRGGQAQAASAGGWSAREGGSENVADPDTSDRIGPNSTFHTVA